MGELGFCVSVVHTHKFIILYLQVLGMKKNKVLTQLAQNYMSDCMRTNVLVKYTPQAVACGCICYSTRLLGVEVPTTDPYWSTLFDVSFETLECVMRDISMAYLLPPVIAKMRKEETEKAKQLLEDEKVKATLELVKNESVPQSDKIEVEDIKKGLPVDFVAKKEEEDSNKQTQSRHRSSRHRRSSSRGNSRRDNRRDSHERSHSRRHKHRRERKRERRDERR